MKFWTNFERADFKVHNYIATWNSSMQMTPWTMWQKNWKKKTFNQTKCCVYVSFAHAYTYTQRWCNIWFKAVCISLLNTSAIHFCQNKKLGSISLRMCVCVCASVNGLRVYACVAVRLWFKCWPTIWIMLYIYIYIIVLFLLLCFAFSIIFSQRVYLYTHIRYQESMCSSIHISFGIISWIFALCTLISRSFFFSFSRPLLNWRNFVLLKIHRIWKRAKKDTTLIIHLIFKFNWFCFFSSTNRVDIILKRKAPHISIY